MHQKKLGHLKIPSTKDTGSISKDRILLDGLKSEVPVTFLRSYECSKSTHVKNLLFESQAKIDSYFKGTKTYFMVKRFLFEAYLA